MDIEQFLNKVKPGNVKTQLGPHLENLRTLRQRGYTLPQMQEFLKENGIETTIGGLSAYLRRNAPKTDATPKTDAAPKSDKPAPAKADKAPAPKVDKPADKKPEHATAAKTA